MQRPASCEVKTSKDEIELYNLCKSHFHDVTHNKSIVDGWDADIIINDHHLIFWNGPWHYKDLNIRNHSLLQVQTRDCIKLNKFLDLGYDVLIYEDRYFSAKEAFEDIKTWITGNRGGS